MTSIDLSSILSSILGGLLAFSGVYFAQRSTTKQTNKTLRRDKLEELYTLLVREKKYISLDMAECALLKTTPKEIDDPHDRINMIISLYFPELRKLSHNFDEKDKRYTTVLREFWEYIAKNGDKPPHEFFDPVAALYLEIKDTCNDMLAVLEKDFTRLI